MARCLRGGWGGVASGGGVTLHVRWNRRKGCLWQEAAIGSSCRRLYGNEERKRTSSWGRVNTARVWRWVGE